MSANRWVSGVVSDVLADEPADAALASYRAMPARQREVVDRRARAAGYSTTADYLGAADERRKREHAAHAEALEVARSARRR